jgi:hypothetical protein
MRGVARSTVEEEHNKEKPMTLLFSKNANLFIFFQRLSKQGSLELASFLGIGQGGMHTHEAYYYPMSVLLSTQWSHLYFDQSGISYFSVHMRKLLKPSGLVVVHTHLK